MVERLMDITLEELEISCEAGNRDSCIRLREMQIMANNEKNYASGGLLSDSSRLWKMESEYPEYQKGIANKTVKSQGYAIGGEVGYNTLPLEEQFEYSPLQQGYAEGGEVDNLMDTSGSLLQPEVPLDFENDMPMGDVMPMESEEEILDGLSPEDQEVLFQAMSDYPELEEILNTIGANTSSEDLDVFSDEGSVEGPGTGTSDSIPANLSDGEFVFTAKAVQHIGVDKLRKMMAKAEMDADEGDQKQEYAQMGNMGFAAGGLLTRGNFATGGISKSDFPEGSYATDDEGTSTGELTPGIGKETRDRGNPHIGEKEIISRPSKQLEEGVGLGSRLMELLGLDPVTWTHPSKVPAGKKNIHRKSSFLERA